MNSIKKTAKFIAALCFLISSSMAYAHPGHETSISFFSGILHPFSGLDHLLVILLVGFWSAFVLNQIWVGPLAFLLGMMAGVFSGILGALKWSKKSFLEMAFLFLKNALFSVQ